MKYKKIQEEVLRATGPVVTIQPEDIDTLKRLAGLTKRQRVRICIHRKDEEIVQEMFIVHTKDTYIRPHKHLTKKESLFIVEGKTDILLFSDSGKIKKIIPMGDFRSGLQFYMKTEKPTYHSMLIRSKYLVFLEITNGPFRKNETVFAPWSPDDSDYVAVRQFLNSMKHDFDTKMKRKKS